MLSWLNQEIIHTIWAFHSVAYAIPDRLKDHVEFANVRHQMGIPERKRSFVEFIQDVGHMPAAGLEEYVEFDPPNPFT